MTTEGKLLCVCQSEDDGMLYITFHYGLDGMGQETPYKIRTPAIGTISDAFEDIKEKLAKVSKKVEKRQRKVAKKEKQAEDLLNLLPGNDNHEVKSTIIENDTVNCETVNNAEEKDECKPVDQDDVGFEILEQETETIKEQDTQTMEDQIPSIEENSKQENNKESSYDKTGLITVHISNNEEPMLNTTVNEDAWKTDNILTIDICNLRVKYKIFYKPPTVKPFELPRSMLCGYMTYPRAEFLNCERQNCKFEWYKCKVKPKRKLNIKYKKIFFNDTPENDVNGKINSVHNPNAINSTSAQGDNDKKEVSIVKKYEESSAWSLIGTGFVYVPNETDVEHYIKVVCKPDNGIEFGLEYTAESNHVVRHGPGICPYNRRHEYTKEISKEGSFRVLCYNILADKYANTKCALDVFYAYCPPFALGLDYRKQLLMDEILGYKADILCLQEVDQKVFRADFDPILRMHGYEQGFIKTKCKTNSQGVSMFYKSHKFRYVASHDKEVINGLTRDGIHKDLLDKINTNETLKEEVVSRRKAILMVTVLESVEDPTKLLLVANTHLTCGPKIAHIRAIQIAVALKHIEWVLDMSLYREKDISVMLCGDLNSLPESAVIQLLSKSKVSAKHADWFIKGRTEYVSDMDLSTTLQLQTAHPDVRYTNYVSGFYGKIDYIFHDSNKLETISTVPMPSQDEVVENTACPNAKFPSDHLALVCDIKWK